MKLLLMQSSPVTGFLFALIHTSFSADPLPNTCSHSFHFNLSDQVPRGHGNHGARLVTFYVIVHFV